MVNNNNNKSLSRFIDRFSEMRPLLVAFALSPWLLLFYLLVSDFSQSLSTGDLDIIKSFIEWFGTAYSLFLALVLVNVWTQFNNLEHEFDQEVDAVATLYQTVSYARALFVEGEEKKENFAKFETSIREKIEEYLKHVIMNYQNEHVIYQQRRKGDQILEDIGIRMSLLARERLVIDSLIAELYKTLNEARDVRGDRISHSKQRIQSTVTFVSAVASLVWLLPFFGLNITDPVVSLILIGGVTFVILMMLILIFDFDNPFSGTWKIEITGWREFLETFYPNPRVVFVFKHEDWINDLLSRITPIRDRFSLTICKLSSLSWEGFLRGSWRKFINEIQKHHPDIDQELKCDIFYYNEFISQGFEINLRADDFPVALIVIGDRQNILVGSKEITSCENLNDFKKVFGNRIKQYVPWF